MRTGLTILAVLLAGLGALGLVAAGGLYSFTSSKIRKMEMIRGDVPGAQRVDRPISDLERMPGRPGSEDVCWVTFEESTPPRSSRPRVNLPCEQWTALSVGQVVPVAYVPGDDSLYLPDGIYASAGNQSFDETLLGVWRIGIGLGALSLLGGLVLFLVVRLSTKR